MIERSADENNKKVLNLEAFEASCKPKYITDAVCLLLSVHAVGQLSNSIAKPDLPRQALFNTTNTFQSFPHTCYEAERNESSLISCFIIKPQNVHILQFDSLLLKSHNSLSWLLIQKHWPNDTLRDLSSQSLEYNWH